MRRASSCWLVSVGVPAIVLMTPSCCNISLRIFSFTCCFSECSEALESNMLRKISISSSFSISILLRRRLNPKISRTAPTNSRTMINIICRCRLMLRYKFRSRRSRIDVLWLPPRDNAHNPSPTNDYGIVPTGSNDTNPLGHTLVLADALKKLLL